MTVYIYALCEPGTREVRYIGRSNNPHARLTSHMAASAAQNIREWVAGLGCAPLVAILHEVPAGEDPVAAERTAIAAHAGPRLLNVQCSGRSKARSIQRPPTNRGAAALCALNLSQKVIAERVGADQARVCRWMNGQRIPGLDAAVRMEDAFGIPMRAWFQPALRAVS